MKIQWHPLRARRARAAAARRAEYLEQEKEWWSFQARMDYLYDKITEDEWVLARQQIASGVEYVGVARRPRL